jgi:hypothetical protein
MAFTRAASAASSQRAKQELVRLLFGSKCFRRGADAHRMLDHSIYSHAQLKSAYLERLHELHPDKRRAGGESHQMERHATDASSEFVSLQDAWSNYEEFAKALKRVENGTEEASFTLFGVGCSFSDNERERSMRNEITDQACRGWFSAGELGEGGEWSRNEKVSDKQTSLLDENMFTSEESSASSDVVPTTRKSLIDHMMVPKR